MENSELVRIDLAARQIVNVEDPKSCPYCGGSNLIQDPDVLDTWFSSALWPHSTLGWPESTRDLDYFYPTTVMETGYDILFFWVARMIMMGLYNLGEVPFTTVYLHGLIRDEKGEKMSKSRGNVVDPLEAMERYGTDALRFALSTGSSPGNDMRLSVQKLEGSRNFANKLWNAARFVLSNLGGGKILTAQENSLSGEDRWILSRLNRLVAGVDKLFQDFQFGEAERQIHDFLWGEFCDWYVEMSKIRLRNREEGPSPLPVLTHVLETSLRLLHPFMPFITEEIWQGLRQRLPAEDAPSSITLAPYPIADEAAIDPEIEREMESVIEIVRAIRNARAEAKVEPSKSIEALVLAGEGKSAIESHASSIAILARARPLTILGAGEEGSIPEKAVTLVLKETKVVLPLAGLVDLDRERKRLEREAETSRDKVARLENKLRDQAFLAKAPPNIVEREREKLSEWRKRLERLREELEAPGTGD